jgi:choline dehydrogenase-like flavoprotein
MKDRRYWWDYVLYKRKPYDSCEDRDGDNPSVGGTPWHSVGSRTMMYGGSTAHWGGWSMRFKPEDFRLKTNTGRGGDWPYDYDTLEPYYCRADEYLSVCGDDNDPWRSKPYPLPPYPYTEPDGEMIQAFRALGITPGHMPIARYRKCMATGTCKYCPFGARFSGSYILDDLLSEPRYTNLKYIGMAPATRLVAESKRRIHQVEYLDPGTGQTVVASGDRIIVCSGAYEAPKLLMMSTSSHWEHGIGNDHDLVGRYAISHPFLSVSGTKPKNEERWIQEYDFPSLMSRTYDTEANQAKKHRRRSSTPMNWRIIIASSRSRPANATAASTRRATRCSKGSRWRFLRFGLWPSFPKAVTCRRMFRPTCGRCSTASIRPSRSC